MADAAAAAAALAAQLNHVIKVVQIYVASTSAVLVWDWLSCLPMEWKYIWKSQWSPMKGLYILVRYYTFAVLIVTDTWFFLDWSEASCSKYLRVLPGVAVIIDVAIECVLCLRVYAIYGGDRKIAAFLIVLLLAFTGVMIAVPILAFDYIHLPAWPGPCVVTGKASIAGPKFILAFYASPMAVDTVTTIMTVYKVLERKRAGGFNSLLEVFIRDGLFYFIAITSLNLINVIFFVQPDELIQSVNAPMSIQLSSVLCSRLILNLRSQAKPAASRNVKHFTRGRWVTDVEIPDTVVEHDPMPSTNSVALSNMNMFSANKKKAQPDVSQFGEDPKKSTLPLAFSTMATEPGHEETHPGVVVHWTTEQESWDQKVSDADSRLDFDTRR